MSERETLGEVVQGIMDARCLNHPANYGGCTECSPIAEEVTDAALSWLAGVLADDATGKVVARRLDEMNVTGWIVVPNRNTGEPMQEQVPPSYVAQGVLAALSAHLAPARDGDTSGEDGL